MKIPFVFSKIKSTTKPPQSEVFKYQNINNYSFEECSISEIADLISTGHAWRAAIYKDGITSFKKDNAKGSHIIALDFDNCVHEPQAIIDYAESIGIPASLFYFSYSQGIKSNNNFRLLWIFDKVIEPKKYEAIYIMLLGQFKDYRPDTSTKDISRLWYGTSHRTELINKEPLNLSSVGWLVVCEKTKKGIATKDIKKSKTNGVNEYFNEPPPEGVEVKKLWYEQLRGKCMLWDMWEQGQYLNYNQRLTLFTNLKYITNADTGTSIFKDVMNFFNPAAYINHTCDENQIKSMMLNKTLTPRPIVLIGYESVSVPEFFKRYKDGDTVANRVRNMLPKIPLYELDKMLDERMPQLLGQSGITYIKAQTACGKTERVIQWLLEQDLSSKRIIYSAPTYNTIDEFIFRFKKCLVLNDLKKRWRSTENFQETISKKEVMEAINDKIKNLEDCPIYFIPKGRYQEKDKLLLEMGLPPQSPQTERNKAIRYMMNTENKGVFVCTHALISHLKEVEADLIIIDENIEDALLDVVEYSQSGLSSLLPFVGTATRLPLLRFIESIGEMERGQEIDIKPLKTAIASLDWEAYINADVKQSGIGKVFMAAEPHISTKRGLNTIRFVQKSTLIDNALKNNIPIKLMSATPKAKRLSLLYNTNEIELVEFPLAENKGKIYQWMGITGAKGINCEKVKDIIEFVNKALDDEEKKRSYVLSYKDAISQWIEAGYKVPDYNGNLLHIANNAGLDVLKGKTVIVAGKYDDNDDVYIDTYYDLFPNAKNMPKRINQSIEINGKTVKLFLWEDKELMELQLEKIRQFTEQAAGRARALREQGAKVYVFCNYPLPDVDEFISCSIKGFGVV